MDIKALVGSGDSIMLFTLPFAVLGVVLNLVFPSFFDVGGPSHTLTVVSVALVTFGGAIWAWSVVLILTKVPGRKLITSGPYAVVKHPLYTGVALLVLPWAGFLFNTWIGVLLGIAMYVGSRIYAPREERILSEAFGTGWDEYCGRVKIPWL
jgi:protein-S-isoprenylcysteine O-methyltransferase Ste14